MSLEQLISKYLDGELTQTDDARLRQMIADNDAARQRFDDAVEVHLALREDADSIDVPADLFKSTEDQIMMKILDQKPVANKKVFVLNSWRRQLVAAAVIVFAFSFVYNIYDSNYDMNNFAPAMSSGPNIEMNDDSRDNIDDITTIINNNTNTESRSSDVKSDAINNNISSDIVNIVTDNFPYISQSISNDDDGQALVAPTKQDIILLAENTNNSDKKIIEINPLPDNAIYSSLSSIPAGMQDINYLPDFMMQNDIEMTTFIGTDFYKQGINTNKNQAFSNFSQSVAYSLDDRSKVGLEFGFSQYSYDVNVSLQTSAPTENQIGSSTEVLDPSGNGKYNDLDIPIVLEREERLYWGAAFYEYKLYDNEQFSLSGRLGLGGTSSGYIGYGRIMSKYFIYKGIALTVGLDARMFNANLKNLDRSDGDMKQTASIIYGLQFKF